MEWSRAQTGQCENHRRQSKGRNCRRLETIQGEIGGIVGIVLAVTIAAGLK